MALSGAAARVGLARAIFGDPFSSFSMNPMPMDARGSPPHHLRHNNSIVIVICTRARLRRIMAIDLYEGKAIAFGPSERYLNAFARRRTDRGGKQPPAVPNSGTSCSRCTVIGPTVR